MYAYDIYGLGQDSSGFDLGTALGTSGIWVLVGGGALIWWMLFGQESARERSSELSAAKKRYQSEVSRIKGGYTRTRKRKTSRQGIMAKYKVGDIGPSGKMWDGRRWVTA